ncbi:MAG: hypothetical protein WCJ57_03875 [Candidatus Falkowbacteria bacterium]
MKRHKSEQPNIWKRLAALTCPSYSMFNVVDRPGLFGVDSYEINNLPENISG